MTDSTPSRRTILAGHPGEPSQQAAPAAIPEAACIGKIHNFISRIPAGYLAGYLAGQQTFMQSAEYLAGQLDLADYLAIQAAGQLSGRLAGQGP